MSASKVLNRVVKSVEINRNPHLRSRQKQAEADGRRRWRLLMAATPAGAAEELLCESHTGLSKPALLLWLLAIIVSAAVAELRYALSVVDGVRDDGLTVSLIGCVLLLLLVEYEDEEEMWLLLLGSSIADFTDSDTSAATAAARLLTASREEGVEVTLTDAGGS